MVPNTEVTVAHTDGTTATYPMTPWIIDQWEQMAQISYFHTIHNFAEMDAGNLYLMAFLAERGAGLPVAAWRADYIQTLASIPLFGMVDAPKETPASSTGLSGT